ncbi:MAG: alpha/beta fold hydrolase [Bacteroidota bacterium]
MRDATTVREKEHITIPSVEYGGTGEPLHFLHANGYPPGCYQLFLETLKSRYEVFGMLLRPLWAEASMVGLQDWLPYSEDLLALLEERETRPVIGAGHSIGAIVTLRAALREPERFRALVLLDPVLFPPYFIVLTHLMRVLHLGERLHPLIGGALKRRRTFDDLEAVFRGYRRRNIFRYFDDGKLRAYIRGITRPGPGGGYELAYSPEWEAHIYDTGVWRDMDLWRGLPRLKVPTLIIRGAETDTMWEKTGRMVRRKNPRIHVETLERSTHLLPLERPNEVFELMQAFLKEIP